MGKVRKADCHVSCDRTNCDNVGRTCEPAGGRPQAGLDLSQGHFGTSVSGDDDREVDVVLFGPLSVVIDYDAGTAVKLMDRRAFPTWEQRREAKRAFDAKVALLIEGTHLVASWGRP